MDLHEDAIIHLAIFRLRRVDLEIAELGELSFGLTLMFHTLVTAFAWWIRRHLEVEE